MSIKWGKKNNPFEDKRLGNPESSGGLTRLVNVMAGLTIFTVIVTLIGAIVIYVYFSRDLPQINDLQDYDPYIVSEVYSEDCTKMGEFWKECRYLLPFDEIPKQVIDAFIASEDARFFEHKGVDFLSIARAFIKNMQAGRIVQGASTITQQIARSFFLSRERTLNRKIKEAILATQIEKNLDKNEILHLYLNQIYLGNRAYGIEAAARNYFHKNIEELNLAETALIAGLTSAPARYSPLNDIKAARERQLLVLNRMVKEDFVTRKEAEKARNAFLLIYRAGTDKDFNMKYAPYFTEQVRRILTEKYGEDFVYKNGLRIYTTADLKMIRAAQKALKKGLRTVSKRSSFEDPIKRSGFEGPLAHLKPDEVEAYANKVHKEAIVDFGVLYFPQEKNPENAPTPIKEQHLYKAIVTEVKRNAWHVLVGNVRGLILRQDRRWVRRSVKVGDVVKVQKKVLTSGEQKSGLYSIHNIYFTLEQIPLLEGALYALEPQTGKVRAMVGGYDFSRSEFNRTLQAYRQPGSSFKPLVYAAALDKGYSPRTIVVDSPVTFQVGDHEYWTPKNYGGSFRGPITVKTAFTYSVNVPTVKILHDIGLNYLLAYSHKLGIQTKIHPYLSSALGASDMPLKELVEAYAVFAAEGKIVPAYLIHLIVDAEGNVIERFPPQTTAQNEEEKKEEASTKTSDSKISKMNKKLLDEGLIFIKEKKLNLTNDELKILYGANIPEDHAITPRTAHLMTYLLTNVIKHGTGYRARGLERPAAGKTGTTNDETDALFIGYTPQLIAGIWVGFDELKKIGKRMTGGVIAAPIWLDFMKEALKGKPVQEFAFFKELNMTTIDSLIGGSSLMEEREELPDMMSAGQKESSPDRSVDFLYEDVSDL